MAGWSPIKNVLFSNSRSKLRGPSESGPNESISDFFLSIMSSVKITYNLKPPVGVDINGLEKSKTYELSVLVSPENGPKSYYTALQESITKTKEQIGNDLTAWRDAVGKTESKNESMKLKSEEEEETEEEREGEEEQ